MKIGITGASGQLGRELVKQGGIPLNGRLLSDELQANIETITPDAIINCAAITDVDWCEDRIREAAHTNTAGVRYLSNYFSNCYLIQISTDYVFDGQRGPYSVRDTPKPINMYGWSKLGGELAIRHHQEPSLIVRTTFMFSSAENNFVSKIVKQLEAGDEVSLYNPDILRMPTYVPALATEILRITKAEYTGVAHIAGNTYTYCSRLEFAREIAQTFRHNPDRIIPNITPGKAERPQRAGLICGHDGYKEIETHDYKNGLLELSREGKSYERAVARVDPGRSGSD